MTELNEEFLEMDTSWIREMEKYNDFYVDDIDNVTIHYLFLNENREIQNIEEEITILNTPNILTKEELLYKIKNKLMEVKKYRLQNIIQFNVSLNEQETTSLYNDEFNDFSSYIQELVSIDDVVWNKTSNIFKDMNSIYFILVEKPNKKHNNSTKKIRILERLQKKGRPCKNNTTRKR